MGGIHANGAMLMRSRLGESYEIPVDLPFGLHEAFRERRIRHPLLYIPKPLAIFSKTLDTARRDDRIEFTTGQTVMVGTFLIHARYDHAQLEALFANARKRRPPTTSPLLLVAIIEPKCRHLLRYTQLADWLLLARIVIRRPHLLYKIIQSRRNHPDWWEILNRDTALRFAEQTNQH